MAERSMVIKVTADTSAFTAQVRAAVQAVGGPATVPVGGAGGVAGVAGGLGGVPGGAGALGPVEQAAASAALTTAEARAAMYSAPGIGAASPNWGMIMQQSMTNAMYPVGASSPNWSYLMAQGATASTGASSSTSNQRTSRFFGRPNWSAAKIAAGFGLYEYNTANRTLARANTDEEFAQTPEEAYQIRIEAVESVGSGFFGKTAASILKFAGLGDVHGMANDAREAVQLRKMADVRRRTGYELAGSQSVRDAFGSGGQYAADVARINAERDAKISDLRTQAQDEQQALDARTATVTKTVSFGAEGGDSYSYTAGGDYILTGEARKARQATLTKINQQIDNTKAQADFDNRQHAYDASRFLTATRNATALSYSAANGMTDRGQDLQQLHDAYEDKIQDAYRKGGSTAEGAVRQEYRGTRAAKIAEWTRTDRIETQALLAGAQADTYRAQNRPFDAQIANINADTETAVAYAQAGGLPQSRIDAIKAAGAAKIAAAQFQVNKARTSYENSLETEGNVLGGQFNDKPLASQIAIIEGQRDEDLNNLKADDPNYASLISQINNHANAKMALTYRDFNRGTSDIDRQIQGGIERAGFQIHGGPLAGIRSAISGILQGTDMDVRGLEDSGRTDEAARRRRLGQLQLQGAQNEYFRSFDYREANPNDVVGSGSINGIRDEFRKAKDAVKDAGRHEDAAGKEPKSGWTPDLVQKAMEYFRQIAENAGGLG